MSRAGSRSGRTADVYKRQVKRGGLSNLAMPRTLDAVVVGRISQMTDPALDSERHTFDTVSYTHLDVYKRQTSASRRP